MLPRSHAGHQLTVGGHFNGGATGACAGGRLRPDWSHQSWAPGPAICLVVVVSGVSTNPREGRLVAVLGVSAHGQLGRSPHQLTAVVDISTW